MKGTILQNKISAALIDDCSVSADMRYWPPFIGIALSLLYLIAMPGGLRGLLFALFSLGISFIGVNRQTLGVYFLLIGQSTLGAVFQSFEIYSVGAPVSIVLGFILLFGAKSHLTSLHAYWRLPVIWLLTTTGVFVSFYFLGPQTEYCQIKLILFVINLLITIYALSFLAGNVIVNFWQLGIYGILSSIVYLAALISSFPEITPTSIFQMGDIRIASLAANLLISTNALAIVGSMGMVLLLSSTLYKKQSYVLLMISALALITGIIVLNLSGQRLFILIPFIATSSLILCRQLNKKIFGIYLLLLIAIFTFIVWAGLQSKNVYIMQSLEKGASFGERVNRYLNWDAALIRIEEEPLLGHGWGGYYIDGYSLPGDGTYAHNLLLELLSETGILGTGIIIAPVLFFFLIPINRRILLFRTASGDTLTPLLSMNFLHAMISHDLRQSAALFAITAVLWAYLSNKKNNIQ